MNESSSLAPCLRSCDLKVFRIERFVTSGYTSIQLYQSDCHNDKEMYSKCEANTVEPRYKDHLWDFVKVVFIGMWFPK